MHVTSVPDLQPRYCGNLDFVFVVHPRDIDDIFRSYPELRGQEENAVLATARNCPVTISSWIEVQIAERILHGELISIPYLASEFRFQSEGIHRALHEVFAYCESRGTAAVGLGALIPSITRNGVELRDRARDMALTNGHAFTAYAIYEYVRIFESFIGDECRIGIVGAGGSIGSATLKALCSDGKKRRFTLFDAPARLATLGNAIAELNKTTQSVFEVATGLEDMRRASIIVCTTNAPAVRLRAEHLTPGTVVIDDAQPPNVTREVANAARVTLVKCLVDVPGLTCPFDFGLFPAEERHARQRLTFTCLAETILLAAAGHREVRNVGVPGFAQLREVARQARNLGIAVPTFHRLAETSAF